MKRGNPPQRKTRLVAKTPMPRGKGIKSGAPAKTKARPKTAPKSAIDIVKGRSLGLCEIGLTCFGNAPAVQSAHRRGKGTGGVGPKNATSNTASNLIRGCAPCHSRIDNAEVADAERLGLKLRHGKAHPYEMPVYHYRLGWVLLDDAGGHQFAPAASYGRPEGVMPVVVVVDGPETTCGEVSAELREPMARFGHGRCGGFAWGFDEPARCKCGAEPFIVAVRS